MKEHMHFWKKFGLAPAVVLTMLAGCQSSGGGTSSPDSGAARDDAGADSAPGDGGSQVIVSAACQDAKAAVAITDPTNYTLSVDFDIKTFTVKDATNLKFDWSSLDKDFFGKSLSAKDDIDMVLIALWHLTPSAIENDLKKDDLPLAQNAGVITFVPDGGATSANLNDFTELGQMLPTDLIPLYFDTSTPDYAYPQDAYTFMLMASTGTMLGKGARSIALFHIDPDASDEELALSNDTTKLSYSVDLHRATPVQVPSGPSSVTIDFGQMKTNMLGGLYLPSQITRAAVAHFKSSSLDDLQAKFLDLQSLADEWYSNSSLAGSSVDLGTLATSDGKKFSGIDGSGIWMTALFCDNCNNPAPQSITIMQPCP